MINLSKEPLVGKYLPFEPLSALPPGSIVAGQNLLRKSLFGGWTPRRGYELINTTPVALPLRTVHDYTNPIFGDFHLFVQTLGGLYSLAQTTAAWTLEDTTAFTWEDGRAALLVMSASPLTERTTLGTEQISVGDVPGFSAVIGEDWIYCDGSGAPIIYGGEAPRPDGFMIDNGSGALVDGTAEVRDGSSLTGVTIAAAAGAVYYVGMKERGTGIRIEMSTVNAAVGAVTATVSAWRSGSWTNATASDGTAVGTLSHGQNGTLSWSASALDQMSVIGNRQLFWYRVSFSAAPTAFVISSCRVVRPISRMTNKWDSVFRDVTGALFYDHSATAYVDKLGSVTDHIDTTYMDLSEMTTDDYIYLKTLEPALGFAIATARDRVNTANAEVDLVEALFTGGWATVGAFVDDTLSGTSGFARSGTIWITNNHAAVMTTFQGDNAPGYWYRISVDAALSLTTHLRGIGYASRPATLLNYTGCVEYNGQMILWGDPQFPNRLLVSPYDRPDQLCNAVERYTVPFGGSDAIRNCLVSGDYLVIFKSRGIYMTNAAFDEVRTITSEVGLASPKSAVVIASGDRSLKEDEVRTMIMFQDRDGVYKIGTSQGDFNITKVSGQVRNYFDPYETEYIGDQRITELQAIHEKTTDTYRLFLRDCTLAYSVGTAEWLPVWYHELSPRTGLVCNGSFGEYVVIYGSTEGYLLRVELADSDRNGANAEVAIDHQLTTRPIFANAELQSPAMTGTLRHLWTELAADAGAYALTIYVDHSLTGTLVATPVAPTLTSVSHMSAQVFDLAHDGIYCFQILMRSNTIGQKMEPYSISYQIDQIRTLT